MLELVKHRLPPFWDGVPVTWRPFTPTEGFFLCPAPTKAERCPCGSATPPLIAAGLRPPAEATFLVTRDRKLRKSGRVIQVLEDVPAWPVYDLTAFRCPDCRADVVWDQRTNEWWDLDESDYTPTGSNRPEWWKGAGGLAGDPGLFDLLED